MVFYQVISVAFVISLFTYVAGKTIYFKREDFLDVRFTDTEIAFYTMTDQYRCIEHCSRKGNCLVAIAKPDAMECYLYDVTSDNAMGTTPDSGAVVYGRDWLRSVDDCSSVYTGPVTYQYVHTQKSWDEARSHCRSLGGDLASLDTTTRVQDVASYYAGYSGSKATAVWGGLRRNPASGGPFY